MRWDLAAQDPHATLVGYMGVTALPTVVRRLLDGGMDPATPAAVIEHGTTAAQRSVTSTLSALPDDAVRAGLRPPALFVIGPTVGHAKNLDWVHRFPLAGERLVVYLPGRLDPAASLEAAGAEVVAVGIPVRPAGRVVMAALPLTGCLVQSPAQVASLDGERSGLSWTAAAVSWCLGRDTARGARARGWSRVEELEEGTDPAELVRRIAGLRQGVAASPSLSPAGIQSTIRDGG
jgi:hypothetical protein